MSERLQPPHRTEAREEREYEPSTFLRPTDPDARELMASVTAAVEKHAGGPCVFALVLADEREIIVLTRLGREGLRQLLGEAEAQAASAGDARFVVGLDA